MHLQTVRSTNTCRVWGIPARLWLEVGRTRQGMPVRLTPMESDSIRWTQRTQQEDRSKVGEVHDICERWSEQVRSGIGESWTSSPLLQQSELRSKENDDEQKKLDPKVVEQERQRSWIGSICGVRVSVRRCLQES